MKNISTILAQFNNNSIVAIKGLSTEFIPNEIKEQWFDFSLWENNKLDAQKLISKEFKKSVLALTDQLSSTVYISFEALLAAYPILKEFGYEASIKIVNAQFMPYVINNFSNDLLETNEDCINEDSITDVLIGSVIAVNDNFYIQFKDGELIQDAEVINVFDSEVINYNDLLPINATELLADRYIFNFETNDYIATVYDWISYNIKKIDLVIDLSVFKNEATKSIFGNIVNVLKALDIDVIIHRLVYDLKSSSNLEVNALLQKYWGESAVFKSLKVYADPDISNETIEISQATIIETIIDAYEKGLQPSSVSNDVFFTASTGAGKSLMFQIPAIYLANKYNTLSIIVTPLKALMEDQVYNLKNRAKYNRVACINSDVNYLEREQTLELIEKGEIDLLYLAPESLLSYDINDYLRGRKLGLYIVDEAHTVTTWGRDFRADYWYLGGHIQKLRSKSKYNKNSDMHFVVVGATATAPYNGTHDVVFETISSLNMRNTRKFIGNVRRDDIVFDINCIKEEVKGNLNTFKEKTTLSRVQEYENNGDKTIVYCPYSSQVISLVKNKGELNLTAYYGKLETVNKQASLDYFKNNKIATMVATKAFGMGIDISDITRVYHYAPTGLLTDYLQEIGRAARKPGVTGIASVDYTKRDFQYVNVLHGLSRTHDWQLVEVMKRIYKNYEKSKKANQLLNVEDFVHIFGNSDTIANDMKNALLLIEKDLQMKSGQTPIIIARPKNLFATVYASMTESDFEILLSQYGKDKVQILQKNKNQDGRVFVTLELDKIWEQSFQKQSFAFIKSLFYKRNLFSDVDVKPVLRMDLNLNQSLNETLDEFKSIFAKIQLAFLRLSGFFSAKDFIDQLILAGLETNKAKAIGATILTIFSKADGREKVSTTEMLDHFSFIQKRRTETDFEYRLATQAMDKIFSKVRTNVAALFKSGQTVSRFVCINSSVHQSNTLVGQILDILDLGSCTTKGGENAKMFVRVNDPFRLRSIMNNEYENSLIADIKHRHKEGITVMQNFFETKMDNETRWNFIEDYFLGKI